VDGLSHAKSVSIKIEKSK